jgi:hypothetical protein
MGSDARQRLAGAALVNATWWSAATGLYPTRALRQVGLVGDPPLHGERTASVMHQKLHAQVAMVL